MACKYYCGLRVKKTQENSERMAITSPWVTRHYCDHSASKFTKKHAESVELARLLCAGSKDKCNVDGGNGYEE